MVFVSENPAVNGWWLGVPAFQDISIWGKHANCRESLNHLFPTIFPTGMKTHHPDVQPEIVPNPIEILEWRDRTWYWNHERNAYVATMAKRSKQQTTAACINRSGIYFCVWNYITLSMSRTLSMYDMYLQVCAYNTLYLYISGRISTCTATGALAGACTGTMWPHGSSKDV